VLTSVECSRFIRKKGRC